MSLHNVITEGGNSLQDMTYLSEESIDFNLVDAGSKSQSCTNHSQTNNKSIAQSFHIESSLSQFLKGIEAKLG